MAAISAATYEYPFNTIAIHTHMRVYKVVKFICTQKGLFIHTCPPSLPTNISRCLNYIDTHIAF